MSEDTSACLKSRGVEFKAAVSWQQTLTGASSDEGVTHRFVHREICGQVFAQADGPDVGAGQRLVATGTRVQVLRAVLDQEVVRPVSRPSPATALHLVEKNLISQTAANVRPDGRNSSRRYENYRS